MLTACANQHARICVLVLKEGSPVALGGGDVVRQAGEVRIIRPSEHG